MHEMQHRMHEMQPIVTDFRHVCLSRGSTRLDCAKTAEQIKSLFGVNTVGGPRNIVLDGGPDPPTTRGKRSWCSFHQINLATFLFKKSHKKLIFL